MPPRLPRRSTIAERPARCRMSAIVRATASGGAGRSRPAGRGRRGRVCRFDRGERCRARARLVMVMRWGVSFLAWQLGHITASDCGRRYVRRRASSISVSLQKVRKVLRLLRRELGRQDNDVSSSKSKPFLLTDGNSVSVDDQPERVLNRIVDPTKPVCLVCLSGQAKHRDSERRLPGTEPSSSSCLSSGSSRVGDPKRRQRSDSSAC